MHECEHAKRATTGQTLLCTKAPKNGQQLGICGNQYFCRRTGRWEHTANAKRCPLAAGGPQSGAGEAQKKPAKKQAQKKKTAED